MNARIMIIIAGVLLMSSVLFVIDDVSAQSDDYSPSGRDYVPYAENQDIEFTEDGNINYDSLIAKIMPEIFENILRDSDVDVDSQDIVLNRGFQIAMYQPRSYNCGYAIDQNTDQVFWLEAAINSTQIEYTNVYDDIPREDNFKPGMYDCFTPLEIELTETFLKEKSYFTPDEELYAASLVKHYLRGNDNLNEHQFAVGKFNFDYKDETVFSFCGKFEERIMGSGYFSGLLDQHGYLSFGLERSLPSLCALDDNATLYDIKFKENPNLDESLQTWKNTRMETVHVKPSSVEKFLERNYLYVNSINHSILYYSSHLSLEHVDYQPKNSSTILTFTPSEKESYMKIRLRDTGVSYYQSYGSEDWNIGELLNLSILVDDKDVSYTQFPYVKSPKAPYPQYYTDSIFKIPPNSIHIEVKLDIENYDFDEENSDWTWRDYGIKNEN